MTEKSIPEAFHEIWKKSEELLREAAIWIIVGYSFPEYDQEINSLLKRSSVHGPRIHILNPDNSVAPKVQRLLKNADIRAHPGLPDAISEIPRMLRI